MNFFEHQDDARRQTRWLVFLFVIALIAIMAAVDLALLVGFGLAGAEQNGGLFTAAHLRSNAALLAAGAVATGAVILLASLFRTLALRSGGGKVAAALGGSLVEPDTRDPLKRRLVNVVEEIALASGVPVPEVYVLEQEDGINAFAAGYSPSDAAIAVTRGMLEKLDRHELQGVIAHEFSHVLNGDMRINIRLMGALFGILLLALIGRRVLYHGRYVGRSRDKAGAGILILAVTLTVVGYVGLFFGRWIKSAVSRKREFLADASAVQFTRAPDGIAGALKKIAVYGDASWLNVDTEEVGHMLFGPGRAQHLFATHPPLLNRIARIEPGFTEKDLEEVAETIKRDRTRRTQEKERSEAAPPKGPAFFDPGRIVEQIGNPDFERLLIAAALAASIPEAVSRAAHNQERAHEVLLYSVLDDEAERRERQLLYIAESLGGDTEAAVRALAQAAGSPRPEQRLPLLEFALPGLRRQPPKRIEALLSVLDRVIRLDGRVEVFEYLLVRSVRQYVWEASNPHAAAVVGRRPLRRLADEVLTVLAVVATLGHSGDLEAAERAFRAGAKAALGRDGAEWPGIDDWTAELDAALTSLDALEPAGKQSLVEGLIATVTHDGRLVTQELELMRAVSTAVHVPLPAISAG